MHKPPARAARAFLPPKPRRNRKRRDWNPLVRRFCALALALELAVALFANPYFRVTQARVDGARTLGTEAVFRQARVPEKTNIFWMALREPFGKRLEKNPVVESAGRTIELPNTLILTVRERQPYAVLRAAGAIWEMDKNGIPFRQLDAPTLGLPVIDAMDAPGENAIVPGKKIAAPWLADAYALLALLDSKKNLEAAMIKVDQNCNLCLNRSDNLQIRLGQPEELPWKVTLAQTAVAADGGNFARSAAYIDLSCPAQPAWMPRPENAKKSRENSDKRNSDKRNSDQDGKAADAHGRFPNIAAP